MRQEVARTIGKFNRNLLSVSYPVITAISIPALYARRGLSQDAKLWATSKAAVTVGGHTRLITTLGTRTARMRGRRKSKGKRNEWRTWRGKFSTLRVPHKNCKYLARFLSLRCCLTLCRCCFSASRLRRPSPARPAILGTGLAQPSSTRSGPVRFSAPPSGLD